MTGRPLSRTRRECVDAAARCLAAAYLLREELPPAEAARRAYTPTGPSLDVLEDRIRARRGLPPRTAAS